MAELRIFPATARLAEVRTVAQAAFGLAPRDGDRLVVEAAGRHGAELRRLGVSEPEAAADTVGFGRAVSAELADLDAEAVRADPEERAAAREIVGAVFARMQR